MKRFLLAASLMSHAVFSSAALDPHVKALEGRDPNRLGYLVVVGAECPFEAIRIEKAVKGVLVRSRLEPVAKGWIDSDRFGLSIILSCIDSDSRNQGYSLDTGFSYLHNGAPVTIANPYGIFGLQDSADMLDAVKNSVEEAVTDYILANSMKTPRPDVSASTRESTEPSVVKISNVTQWSALTSGSLGERTGIVIGGSDDGVGFNYLCAEVNTEFNAFLFAESSWGTEFYEIDTVAAGRPHSFPARASDNYLWVEEADSLIPVMRAGLHMDLNIRSSDSGLTGFKVNLDLRGFSKALSEACSWHPTYTSTIKGQSLASNL